MERTDYDIRRPQVFVSHTPTIDTIGITERIMEYFTDTLVKNNITTSEDVNNGRWLPNTSDIPELRDAVKYQLDLIFADLGYHTRNLERWEYESKYPEYKL